MNDAAPFDHLSLLSSLIICFLFAITYILTLYIFSPSTQRFDRNHSNVIVRRLFAVSIVCFIIYFFLKNHCNTNINVNQRLGFRTDILSVWKLVFYPVLLTLMLYAGPMLQWILLEDWKDSSFHWSGNERMIFLRNYLFAPFTEEFVFRSAMLCVLYSHISLFSAIFYSPLFFGLAHFHHMLEHFYRNRLEKKQRRISTLTIFLNHLFQFSYTYLFGVYSSFLFIRTGHLLPPFLIHSLCNCLGMPDFQSLQHSQIGFRKVSISVCYLFGLYLFFTNLFSFTQSKFYYSNDSTSTIYPSWANKL